MSPTNAKALNTMRQRLKKHNTSEEYADLVTKFRWVVVWVWGGWGGTGGAWCCVTEHSRSTANAMVAVLHCQRCQWGVCLQAACLQPPSPKPRAAPVP